MIRPIIPTQTSRTIGASINNTPNTKEMAMQEKETIHSGHFMISNVPQDEEDDAVEDIDSDFVEDIQGQDIQAQIQTAQDNANISQEVQGPSGGSSRRTSSSLRKSSSKQISTTTPAPQYSAVGGRHRSNSDPMNEDAYGMRSRMNLTQRKVIDSSLSKLFECMTLAYK